MKDVTYQMKEDMAQDIINRLTYSTENRAREMEMLMAAMTLALAGICDNLELMKDDLDRIETDMFDAISTEDHMLN